MVRSWIAWLTSIASIVIWGGGPGGPAVAGTTIIGPASARDPGSVGFTPREYHPRATSPLLLSDLASPGSYALDTCSPIVTGRSPDPKADSHEGLALRSFGLIDRSRLSER